MHNLLYFILFSLSIPLVQGFHIRNSWTTKRSTILQATKYPLSQNYYENMIHRLNSRNLTVQDATILGLDENAIDFLDALNQTMSMNNSSTGSSSDKSDKSSLPRGGIRIIIGRDGIRGIPGIGEFNFNRVSGSLNTNSDYDDDGEDDSGDESDNYASYKKRQSKKSENFEVISNFPIKFADVGGYENIKAELGQCVDILSNFTKYTKYNVRVPRGIIFEGPPGNGKTMMAKALAGEARIPFIPVSGAQFQEKYVGVGSSRIRELFELAKKHAPVIIFIDEIDAVGRKRSGDGESSGSERDNTLNELLIAMDGFKNNTGIFIVGATNRADLLDPALLRPGRIDKRIFIGNPDPKTREQILRIHTRGKPYDAKISLSDLVDMTSGLSGAQIENLVNEAMLNALRFNREIIATEDIDLIMNKMMVGWQPNEHLFTSDIIDHIAIHELGHAVIGLLSKHHSKMTKVVINLSAPKSPAYTVFENAETPIYTREALFEHLMILLGGRIAEEVFYNVSVTTGAINDFEEALKLAEKMVVYYGMGKTLIYPSNSEKYKAIVDDEVSSLIETAYAAAYKIVAKSKDFIEEAVEILKRDNIIRADALSKMIRCKYPELL
jgi:cell division protease FtsH